ncbi:ROK family protein [Streptomyces lavendulae]|uniref:ROK family protein n=1 Tax=Streptomyces lavendulae TaxID=1914 RepID=UPI0024A1C1F0|nr:ROK family protein [Streptomyces lavendulae]GLX17052.1 xylose repressor [Streptomyces lavendulae subsp. lavendulae]GLX29559.1 xylose repressor [Streptomyces lavendulae subsp. lavendulae]
MTALGRPGGGAETAPASQRGMRRQNLAAVLGAVAAHGPLSRADVAGHTGLTRPAVSSLVDELIGRAALTETETAPSGRVGRPGRALALNDRGPAGLGLEIGVGHLAACVVDLRGEPRVWRRVERANAGRSADRVLGEAAALAADAESEAAALGLHVEGRVLAVPGVVPNAPGGLVANAPNLGWQDVRPADHWPDPDTVPEPENEANLGALAEQRQQGHPAATFVHVSAEAGIGAALVIGGRLFRGARGFAGELGHLPVHPQGAPCPCGARGCLEQYAGQAAVLREAGLAGAGDPVTVLAERAGAGDAAALRALDRAGRALGLALVSAVDLIDPDGLVLGGAYAELADWLLPPIRSELAARVTVRPWPPEAVRPSALGRRGPVLGAAWSTVRQIIADPARLPARQAA